MPPSLNAKIDLPQEFTFLYESGIDIMIHRSSLEMQTRIEKDLTP